MKFTLSESGKKRIIVTEFYNRFGHPPDLENPITYCEKLQWLKLYEHQYNINVIERADKYLVRKYVEEIGLGEHLVTLYGVYNNPKDIDWQKLPRRFILKLNNGSGPQYRWFVKDKLKFSVSKFEQEAMKMGKLFDKGGHKHDALGEFHYGKIIPKIIAEEYLESEYPFIDYQFYCFHGKIDFLRVEKGWAQDSVEDTSEMEYYDSNWRKSAVDFVGGNQKTNFSFKKPINFDHMVFIAETLSQNYPHLRVDLYNVNNRIYFGELTYTPGQIIRWKPQSLDFEYGKLIDLENMYK